MADGTSENLDPNKIYHFLRYHQQTQDEWQQANTAGKSAFRVPAPVRFTQLVHRVSSDNVSRSSRPESTVFDTLPSLRTSGSSSAFSLRRKLLPCLADDIANQTPRHRQHVLPCEFSWMGYGGQCDVNFHPHETDLWIDHIISCHLRETLPSKVLCWFCDDYEFDAKSTKGDRRANFDNRMTHIRDHLNDGKTVHDIRPDFYFLDHLKKHELVSKLVAEKVTTYEGSGHSMSGIYKHDWLPDEQVQENERRARVVVNHDREDRKWRRERGRRRNMNDRSSEIEVSQSSHPQKGASGRGGRTHRDSNPSFPSTRNVGSSLNLQNWEGVSSASRPAEPVNKGGTERVLEGDERSSSSADILTVSHIIRACVEKMCSDICTRFHRRIDDSKWLLVSGCLPRLIEGFAAKIDLDPSSDGNCRITKFIHNHSQEIASDLWRTLYVRIKSGMVGKKQEDMSIEDKMSLWGRVTNATYDETNADAVYGGEENYLRFSVRDEFSVESRALFSSSAYTWLLDSIGKELSLHWHVSEPRLMFELIRDKILNTLPKTKFDLTGRPAIYQVSFKLPWESMKAALHDESGKLKTPLGPVLSSILVFTASSRSQVQATTVGQYLLQTWTTGGRELLRVISQALDSQGDTRGVVLPDQTKIDCICLENLLSVTITGIPCSITDLAEQVAWLSAAVQSSNSTAALHGCPFLTYPNLMDYDESQHQWAISVTSEHTENTNLFSLQEKKWKELFGCQIIVRGFPTLIRPTPCWGLEISPEKLLGPFKTPHLTIHDGKLILRGNGNAFEGKVKAKSLIAWYILGSSGSCGCRFESSVDCTLSSLNDISLLGLQKYRHIFDYCACDEHITQGSEGYETRGRTKQTHCVSKSGSEAAPSSNDSPRFATGTPNSQVTANSTATPIDSDLLSMSDNSEENILETSSLSPNHPGWPIVDHVARRIVTEFGRNTYNEIFKGEIFTQSSECMDDETSAAPQGQRASSQHQPGRHANRSTTSRKRPRGHNREDEEPDENRGSDSKGPRPTVQEYTRVLACPFWKADPAKHKACFWKKLDEIKRIKQHLARNHTPDNYCDRCMVIFFAEEDYEEHKKVPCVLQESLTLDGITRQQARQLSRRSDPSLSTAEQWFAIWKIIFPRHPLPSSPYQDAGLSEDFCRFREFAESRGASLLAQELRVRGLHALETDNGFNLENIVTQSIHRWLEEWIASLPLESGASSLPQHHIDQRSNEGTHNETASSSVGDSGVFVRQQERYFQTRPPSIQDRSVEDTNSGEELEPTLGHVPEVSVTTENAESEIHGAFIAPFGGSSLLPAESFQSTNNMNSSLNSSGSGSQFGQPLLADNVFSFEDLQFGPEDDLGRLLNQIITDTTTNMEWPA